MHNLEFNLKAKNITSFLKWDSYNPKDFNYNFSYTKPYTYNYTLEEEPGNIYFIDHYSHTYPEEDRARIFENICSYSENSMLKDYEYLYAKGLYLKKEILTNYPMLENTTLFNSLN